MSRGILIDTAYLVALLDTRDRWHRVAFDLAREFERQSAALHTTDMVLTEFGHYFARSPLRTAAAQWVQTLRAEPAFQIAEGVRALQLRGEARYRKYPDKAWSVTDCVSMEYMVEKSLSEVATTDAHFEQGGFRILLK